MCVKDSNRQQERQQARARTSESESKHERETHREGGREREREREKGAGGEEVENGEVGGNESERGGERVRHTQKNKARESKSLVHIKTQTTLVCMHSRCAYTSIYKNTYNNTYSHIPRSLRVMA